MLPWIYLHCVLWFLIKLFLYNNHWDFKNNLIICDNCNVLTGVWGGSEQEAHSAGWGKAAGGAATARNNFTSHFCPTLKEMLHIECYTCIGCVRQFWQGWMSWYCLMEEFDSCSWDISAVGKLFKELLLKFILFHLCLQKLFLKCWYTM